MTKMRRGRWVRGQVVGVVAILGLLAAAACGDDSEPDDEREPEASAADQAAEDQGSDELSEALRIHVTNDDGVEAPGIDAVVEALHTLDDVEVIVVSPLEDNSGRGDSVSDGPLEASEAETLSGRDALAVDGTPADSVVWAHEEHFGVDVDPPHLTVSGSNGGQNIGVLAYVSGTVGAARQSARQGVPALAVSQQFGDEVGDYDLPYATAIPFMLDWIEEHREALLAGDLALDTVASLNAPTCTTGEVRGLFETDLDLRPQGEDDLNLFAPSDCTSDEEPEGYGDVEGLQLGFATLTDVPVEEPEGTDDDAETDTDSADNDDEEG